MAFIKPPKVISARKHAVIDYIHVGVNFAMAAYLWKRNRKAAAAALGLGAGILANALMTDYPLGVFRLYSFKVHGIIDYSAAGASSVMPRILGLKGTPEGRYFGVQGSAESAIAALTDYSDRSGATKERYALEE